MSLAGLIANGYWVQSGAALPGTLFNAGAGIYQYTVPAGVNFLEMRVKGGGAGGGGGGSSAAAAAQIGACGGAMGSYVQAIRSCIPGEIVTVTVGAGGAAGTGGAAGGNNGTNGGVGGNTTVAIPSSGTVTALGATNGRASAANSGASLSSFPYGVAPGSLLGLMGGPSNGVGGPSSAAGNGEPGTPLVDIGGPGGGGCISSTTNGGGGGSAANGLGPSAQPLANLTGTTSGGNGTNAPANTGGGGGGGGGGTGGTGVGGNGGIGADGYSYLKPWG